MISIRREILPSSLEVRTLIIYERSGVKEYWLVFPSDSVIDVYALNEDNKYERNGLYQYPDKIKVGILTDLYIDLGLVFMKD